MKYIKFTNLNEEKLSTEARNKLPDSEFGIPSLRKFPLQSKHQTMLAIRMFNHVDQEHEAELARNIIRKMKEYNISPDVVGENNRLRKYL
jgi:hypothetical protein